jgi:uroporphyrin-III C-methyltransferase / precorrin-2 dehydrogenase / sirohydrochlorin ferrochelatase
MTGPAYPLLLDLAGRRVLVVGGGTVAARRAWACLDAGADVDVVAPTVGSGISALAADGRVRWERRGWTPSDLEDAWLVHACTSDRALQDRVAAEAERRRVFCVRSDAADRSAAWVPAVTRYADTTVAVNAGGDPRRAVAVRNGIAALLATGRLPLRGRRRRAGIGSVALVGGGPGDPGLITVRGRLLLARADVVVADRLAPRELLDELDPDVEVVDAGKRRGDHRLEQDEINALLVDRARHGARVVRLKGGDPFVFGRGGEEALACVEAGVPFEVVPGVSSATAVPAYAGIPVTHRGAAQEVTVVAAHAEPGDPESTVGWDGLARSTGTLVMLMGLSRLAGTAAELVARGRDATTPAAVIASGTTAEQRVVVADLATIADVVAAADLRAPAITVVGDVVRLREHLAWVG